MLIFLSVLLSACATTKGVGEKSDPDPLENVNRKVYKFNTTVDKYVVKPVADGYVYVTPKPVQTGVTNFFTNLNNINVVLNDFLQGKVKQGFSDTGRFAVNTTLGLLGLFDVATHLGLEQHDEDFGQTLGVWGVAPGPYLVLPFLGPTTLRETPGYAVDAVTNPVVSAYPPLLVLDAVDSRARAEGALKFIDEAALDPYVFTRESYLQWREYQIHDGNPPTQDAGEFDEFEDFDDLDDADEAVSEAGEEGLPTDTDAGQADDGSMPTVSPGVSNGCASQEDPAGSAEGKTEPSKKPVCAAESEPQPASESNDLSSASQKVTDEPPTLEVPPGANTEFQPSGLTHSPEQSTTRLHKKAMESK